MNIPAIISALALVGTNFLPWIYSFPRNEMHVHLGLNEITGQLQLLVAAAALVFIYFKSEWAHKMAWGALGLALMCIFRVHTGENIAGAKMTVGYGVYVSIGISVVLILATRAFRPLRVAEAI
ncbi:MAG: hypothetical protein AAF570_14920 [Bacteroidota bacterium]